MNSDFKLTETSFPQLDLSTTNHPASSLVDSITEYESELERNVQAISRERKRKEANEEAYRQETIRSLRAIEQNTANLYTLVDLISTSNEQQDELLTIITEILSIAKAKTKDEAKSKYKKIMSKIVETVEEAETIAKISAFATTVWNLVQPIIEKLPL